MTNMNDTQTTSLPEQVMNVRQALDAARAMGIDQLDAQLLLLFALGRSSRERAWLLAHDEDTMLKDEQNQYMALLQRRAIGVPLAYLTGEKEFYGLNFSVDRRVLVPRPETELLVDWALQLLPASSTARVLDLGTGSGILAVTLQHERPELEVTAVDACQEALTVATLNSNELLPPESHIRLLLGDWFAPLANEKFDLIVSNPPYVATGDVHLQALSHEPQHALVSGHDGLDDIRRIIAQAATHLLPQGWLLFEHGYDQAEKVQALLESAGFQRVETRKDLAGQNRATGGQLPKL